MIFDIDGFDRYMISNFVVGSNFGPALLVSGLYKLHKLCLSILVYDGANPWTGCTYVDPSLLLLSMSSLAYLISLTGHQSRLENFSLSFMLHVKALECTHF